MCQKHVYCSICDLIFHVRGQFLGLCFAACLIQGAETERGSLVLPTPSNYGALREP